MICCRNSGEYGGRVIGMEGTSCKSRKDSTRAGQLHFTTKLVQRLSNLGYDVMLVPKAA
jgi:predicted ATPase